MKQTTILFLIIILLSFSQYCIADDLIGKEVTFTCPSTITVFSGGIKTLFGFPREKEYTEEIMITGKGKIIQEVPNGYVVDLIEIYTPKQPKYIEEIKKSFPMFIPSSQLPKIQSSIQSTKNSTKILKEEITEGVLKGAIIDNSTNVPTITLPFSKDYFNKSKEALK